MSVKSLRAEHAEKTRTALLNAARELFAKHGYSDVSAEEIVANARVTRGALYHHFKDKKDLFGAVCDEVGAELTTRVEAAGRAAAEKSDALEGIFAGIDAYLDACVEGEFHRIVLVDAPAVHGWDEWRKHAELHELGLIRLALGLAMEERVIRKQPVDTLAPLVFGVLTEGAMLIGQAADRKATRRAVGKAIRGLLEGLRV